MVNWVPADKECNIAWEDLFVNQLECYPLPLSDFQNGVDLYDDTGSHDFFWDTPQLLAQNKSDVVALRTFRNFRPKGMTEDAFKRSKSLFYKSLKPISVIQEAVRGIEEQYFRDSDVVGVHIRRTDYFSYLRQDPKAVAPTELFIKGLMRVLKTNPKAKFFLATDDKNEEQIIRSYFQDAVIVHEKDTLSRLTRDGMRDALIDWLLLSRTSRIIGSYRSSFNEEASAVNMIRLETIPKQAILLNLKAHYGLFRTSGLRKVILYSYYYRKQQLLESIKRLAQ